MKSLKNHISLIIPLFAILFAVEFYFIVNKVIETYQKQMSADYSIIVVAKKPMSMKEFHVINRNIIGAKEIDNSRVIQQLKHDGITLNFKELENFLPKFYTLTLDHFPSKSEVQELQKQLLQKKNITRVEVFLKVHETIYNFLIFLHGIAKVFLVIVFVTSILLVFKQIEVWHLEHKERMYIMALFGAPLWMRNAILIKLSIIDTIISALLVYAVYIFFISSSYFKDILGVEDISISPQDIFYDLVWLVGLGIVISFVNVIIVSLRQPRV